MPSRGRTRSQKPAASRKEKPAASRERPPDDAPPVRLAAQDENFWQAQEARLADQLGQPCCTLSGMCTLLGNVRGNLAVVVHGERDCLNSFIFHRMPAAHRFFTTHVTEAQATRGEVDAPLRECLTLVLEEARPGAVLVLGSCLMSMIGADPQRVIDEVVAELDPGVPVIYLSTSGLRLSTQADMADWLYATLAALPQVPFSPPGWPERLLAGLQEVTAELAPVAARHALEASGIAPRPGPESAPAPEPDPEALIAHLTETLAPPPATAPRILNLIGLPVPEVKRSELAEVLAALAVALGGVYPEGAPLAAWQRVSHARCSAVVDTRLYPQLLRVLEDTHHVPSVQVPVPTGLAQTEAFYARLAEALALDPAALEAALAPHRARAEAAVAAFRDRATGLRLALGLRMLNNYRADQLAYDGLGDVEALRELGFDITLLIQGPREAAPRFAARLEALGCELPFHVFPSPWNLAPLLSEGGYDVAYLADHAREEARKAQVPMIVSRELRLFFSGVEPNLAQLYALLRAAGRPEHLAGRSGGAP